MGENKNREMVHSSVCGDMYCADRGEVVQTFMLILNNLALLTVPTIHNHLYAYFAHIQGIYNSHHSILIFSAYLLIKGRFVLMHLRTLLYNSCRSICNYYIKYAHMSLHLSTVYMLAWLHLLPPTLFNLLSFFLSFNFLRRVYFNAPSLNKSALS